MSSVLYWHAAVQLVGTEFVERGSQIDLKCNATGRPDPPHDVRWMKDGTALRSDDNNENRAVIKKSIEPRALISTLTIRVSRQADAGDYSCQSSNGDMATLRVHVLNGLFIMDINNTLSPQEIHMVTLIK